MPDKCIIPATVHDATLLRRISTDADSGQQWTYTICAHHHSTTPVAQVEAHSPVSGPVQVGKPLRGLAYLRSRVRLDDGTPPVEPGRKTRRGR